jgi:hypothetical protein
MARRASGRTTFKLYVSPHSECVKDAFGEVLAALTVVGTPTFKVGRDVYGLLRPDKIVAYFEEFDHLQDASFELHRRVGGCAVHGVPFTAELAGDGLLSWGIDPPHNQQTPIWIDRESWRLWVTNRLATALLAAKEKRSSLIEPWEFAVERLRLDGVETNSWTPDVNLWRRTATPE